MIDKFGRTLVFLFLILIFVIGAQMALKVSIPYIRTVNQSLADAIESTV
jgi:hypothetical protein